MTRCPTCNAPASVRVHGLDLVAETGDETLATKAYRFDSVPLSIEAIEVLTDLLREHGRTIAKTNESAARQFLFVVFELRQAIARMKP